MNDKAQSMLLLGLVFFAFAILAAVLMITPMESLIDAGRITLDCQNVSISMGEKLTCLAVDAYIPYFFAAILIAAGGYVFVKSVG